MNAYLSNNKRFNIYLKSSEKRRLFVFINVFLLIGVGCLVVTIFYLLFHLHNSDSLIYKCIPGFVPGISSGLVYWYGHSFIHSKE
ncbi:MAG: hypothetical protein HXX13_15525 [Bacteroidetes bacterium]|nr:hypothetical protein [Bacteroidota bacterium]